MFIGNSFRHRNQVNRGQTQELGVRAIASDDAQHCAIGTMTRIASVAEGTSSAAGIYFSDYPLAFEFNGGTLFHHPNEFMANRALEPGIPARDFEICVADSGE
jgi:hypothetical protein